MYSFLFFQSLLLAGPQPATQTITVQYADLKLNGLDFFSAKKEAIIKTLGAPEHIIEPHYECGFLSDEEQGHTFYSLQYKGLQFTGNATDGYVVENVQFSPHTRYRCTYKGQELSAQTTKAQFSALFGQTITEDNITLRNQKSDDALDVIFVGGRLASIAYWSPC